MAVQNAHILPLFRQRDRQSMSFIFDLWSCEDVRAHAQDILQRLRGGSMPCDGAWPADKVELFQRWAESGLMPRAGLKIRTDAMDASAVAGTQPSQRKVAA